MDSFYSKILANEDYQRLNQMWGHKPLQFNLETPFERNYRNKFFSEFKGSVVEIGAGLTPLEVENEYVGIDISTIPSTKFPHIKTADFMDYPLHESDLIYSQDCLMPKMAWWLKIPNKAFIICNGVKRFHRWSKRLKVNEVIEVVDFQNQLESMRTVLNENECDEWVKKTRLRELESILRLELKRYILIKS